jgi:hypothetical protein
LAQKWVLHLLTFFSLSTSFSSLLRHSIGHSIKKRVQYSIQFIPTFLSEILFKSDLIFPCFPIFFFFVLLSYLRRQVLSSSQHFLLLLFISLPSPFTPHLPFSLFPPTSLIHSHFPSLTPLPLITTIFFQGPRTAHTLVLPPST